MKIPLLLLLSFGCFCSYAQYQSNPELYIVPKQKKLPKSKLFPVDSLKAYQKYLQLQPKAFNRQNNMPNALTLQQQDFLKPIYKGNNGNGLDIYASPLDSMPVVWADSTFTANMPTGNIQFLQKPVMKKKNDDQK